ncbi:MAG: hypothetical protein JXK94_11865 [Deltaproteobacteria bacterium]|nr:hypothetical protein [Deltaproteobacteria bacterium]
MSIFRVALIVQIVLLLIGCQAEQRSEVPSRIPVMEPPGFIFLQNTVIRGLDEIERAEAEINKKDLPSAAKALKDVRHTFLKLRHYFIPMTEVRQLIYDADRLYVLKKADAARDYLARARKIVEEVRGSGGRTVSRSLDDVEVMLEHLLLAMEQKPGKVPGFFQTLEHDVNLLLLKGELVLAGVRFTEERENP